MEDYFLLKKLSHAVIAWVLGLVIAFTSLTYVALHIYVPGYSITVPAILTVIGFVLLAWASYRIAIMGRNSEM